MQKDNHIYKIDSSLVDHINPKNQRVVFDIDGLYSDGRLRFSEEMDWDIYAPNAISSYLNAPWFYGFYRLITKKDFFKMRKGIKMLKRAKTREARIKSLTNWYKKYVQHLEGSFPYDLEKMDWDREIDWFYENGDLDGELEIIEDIIYDADWDEEDDDDEEDEEYIYVFAAFE